MVVNRFLVEEDFTHKFYKQAAKFSLNADYFIGQDTGHYQLLGSVYTVYHLSAKDITAETKALIGKALCLEYEHLFDKKRDSTELTLSEVSNYDDFLKKGMPAYQCDSFKQGIYADWKDFVALKPTSEAILYRKGNKFGIVKKDKKGKETYQPYVNAMVLTCDGKAYFNFCYEWYELFKKDGDFYIIGEVPKAKSDNSGAIVMGTTFGLAGALLYSAGMSMSPAYTTINGMDVQQNKWYEFKIDMRTGQLIPGRKINKNKRS